jgi:S1-C subfamily serine protease
MNIFDNNPGDDAGLDAERDVETEAEPTRAEVWRYRLRRALARLRSAVPFAAGVAAAFAALLLYRAAFPPPSPLTPGQVNTIANQVLASATPPPAYSAQVYQVIAPSLVLIQVKDRPVDGKVEEALGSGVVVDDQGDILTALHVVANTTTIDVTFADGTQSTAQVTSQQPQNDIAVIKADHPPAQLYPAILGNPGAMQVGDEAYVVGNPFGLYGSMTAGIISGFNRSFTPPNSTQKLQGLIQIDAAVNPGNSGGPLLNRYGQVVGIVTGLVNPTSQDVFIGIGFAVPINVAGGAVGSPPD